MTLEKLEIVLRESWSTETGSNPGWSPENPALGQCATTACVVQDFFGGKIIWANAMLNGEKLDSHYWNLIDGKNVDLTREQFPEGTVVPEGEDKTKGLATTRDYVLSYPPTQERYATLKKIVGDVLKGQWSPYMLKCWQLAKKSDCQKMNFGSIIILNEKIIGEGYNHVAHPSLEDSCCRREGVQSGTRTELCNAVHAEQVAMISAHKNGYDDLSEATLYVGGIFPDGKRLIKSEAGLYCTLCSRLMAEENIGQVVVPTKMGEIGMPITEILESSFKFATGIKAIKYSKDSE